MKKLIGIALLLFSCAPTKARLDTAPHVDLNRYLGKWYEIAAFPAWFEKGCSCTQAEYSLHPNGHIIVRNTCVREGKQTAAEGKAFVVPNSGNAKLRVQFFWPFKGDYWILELAPDYSYSLVGEPKREYLWILARTPRLEDSTYQSLVAAAAKRGFDVTRLQRTKHNCTTPAQP